MTPDLRSGAAGCHHKCRERPSLTEEYGLPASMIIGTPVTLCRMRKSANHLKGRFRRAKRMHDRMSDRQHHFCTARR